MNEAADSANMDGSKTSEDAPMVSSPLQILSIDIVVKVLANTFFSPFFCIFIPLTLLSQVKDTTHPVFVGSCIWTALITLLSTFKHVDRIYANQASWLLAPPKLDWENQIVLITGGGSGIGALLAETLAIRNVSVVVLTKDKPKYEVANENIYTYTCDVSDFKAIEAAASKIREEVGEPTVLVNNAGVVKGKLLLDLSEDDVRDTFGSNTLAHFWILKVFLPAMIKAGQGHVVSMSSILGVVGAAQMTDYCASKAALVSLHQTLRAELDTRYKTPSIRTTLVIPSFTHTSLFSHVRLPTSWLFNFFAPHLESHVIVKEIIDALDCREGRIIRLPWYANFAGILSPVVGVVPRWAEDLLRWIAGSDHAMEQYGPHPNAAERLALERLKQGGM